jgi:hypothetical protein
MSILNEMRGPRRTLSYQFARIGVVTDSKLTMDFYLLSPSFFGCVRKKCLPSRPVREGVSKGEKDGHTPPALQVGHPPKGGKAVLGVARPQGV